MALIMALHDEFINMQAVLDQNLSQLLYRGIEMLPSRLREMRIIINKKCDSLFINSKFITPTKVFADMLQVYNST